MFEVAYSVHCKLKVLLDESVAWHGMVWKTLPPLLHSLFTGVCAHVCMQNGNATPCLKRSAHIRAVSDPIVDTLHAPAIAQSWSNVVQWMCHMQ